MTIAARPLRLAPLLLLLGGCVPLPRQPDPTTEEGAWARERDRFTRSVKIYDRLDDQAFATATYQALPARLARAERLAVWKGMTAPERDALLAQERAEAEKWEEFLLALFTADRRANDLASPRSTWRVALAVHGEPEVLASRVEELKADPTLETLYPYLGTFDVVYRVRFPRWRGATSLAEVPFTLGIAGALGRIELTWEGK
jgi:hypothetical protein